MEKPIPCDRFGNALKIGDRLFVLDENLRPARIYILTGVFHVYKDGSSILTIRNALRRKGVYVHGLFREERTIASERVVLPISTILSRAGE